MHGRKKGKENRTAGLRLARGNCEGEKVGDEVLKPNRRGMAINAGGGALALGNWRGPKGTAKGGKEKRSNRIRKKENPRGESGEEKGRKAAVEKSHPPGERPQKRESLGGTGCKRQG